MTMIVLAGLCLFFGFVFGVIWATSEVEKMSNELIRLRVERNRWQGQSRAFVTRQKMDVVS